MSGCSRGRNSDNDSLTPAERDARILAIASQFAASGDKNAAQAALAELDLANPGQSVLALAETYIVEKRDLEQAKDLALLAQAMGPLSRMAREFLAQQTSDPSAGIASAGQPAPTATPLPPTDTPTPVPPTDTPEPEPEPTDTPEPTATPTETPIPAPRVVAEAQGLNVRSGPGTSYPVVGSMAQGAEALVLARSPDSAWWQVELEDGSEGWVFASLVTPYGPTGEVAVATNIAPPPATPTPAATATPLPTPVPAGPDFRLVGTRLWGVEENGGYLDGPSVKCGLKRELWVLVIDAAGNPLNGVTVGDRFSEQVTGHKGIPGKAEFVLGNAAFPVILRDVDGREVSSDSLMVSTISRDIPVNDLINAGYCTDPGQCNAWTASGGCQTHHSWDVTFQRNY